MTINSRTWLTAALLQAAPEHALLAPALANALAIHRQTVRHALIEAIRASYPAVCLAVGDEYFLALAAEYIAIHPPRTPVLHEYGGDFAVFIAGFPPLKEWPWLADMARIEWARREAYHAADAEPLPLSQWQAIAPSTLLGTRFDLHPSLRLVESAYPAASLWCAHQAIDATPLPTISRAEICQVWRIGERVHARRIDQAAMQLLTTLQAGQRLVDALPSSPREAAGDVQVRSLLQQLIGDRLVVAAHTPELV